jgi:hypothetical protein
MAEGTQFSTVYNRFLDKITDDMYMELTPQDTIKDLRNLLINAIPEFEFPRKNLMDYTIEQMIIKEDTLMPGDFLLGVLWNDLPEDAGVTVPDVIVERSAFAATLTSEEINILAILMMCEWL